MSVTIRPACIEDIPAICTMLHEHMNAKFSVERWRGMFKPGWNAVPKEIGLVVEDAGRIVGFHGHICSHRMIGGKRERFVNFSSWYLCREYRGQGLGSTMVRTAIQTPNTTYTVFSLSPKRVDMFRGLGLELLEEERLLWRKRGGHDLTLFTDTDVIQYRVWPEQQRILLDNLPYGIKACLVSIMCEECLVLYRESVKQGGRTYFDVLYRSNPRLFTETAQDLANALLPDEDAVLAADKRFVLGPGLDATVERIASPRFYRSETVAREDVDLLYSELQLLDLKLD